MYYMFKHCKNCTKETGRSPTCHSTCKYYLSDSKQFNELKEEERKQKNIIKDVRSAQIDGCNRMKDKNTTRPKVTVFRSHKK